MARAGSSVAPASPAAAEALSTASQPASAASSAASQAVPAAASAADAASVPASATPAPAAKASPVSTAAPAAARSDDDGSGLPWQWIAPAAAAALLAAWILIRRRRADPAPPVFGTPLEPRQSSSGFAPQAQAPAPRAEFKPGATPVAAPQTTLPPAASAVLPASASVPSPFSADSGLMLGHPDSGLDVVEHQDTGDSELDGVHSVFDNLGAQDSAKTGVDVHADGYSEFSERLTDAQNLLAQGRDKEAAEAAREILDVCDALEAELAAVNKQIKKG